MSNLLEPTKKLAVKTVTNVAGEDVVLLLHVFEPLGHSVEQPKAAFVCFFGGGWINGEPERFYNHCRYLASREMVAIAADYRTATRHGTTAFECVADGKSALRYVLKHAAELGIDAGKIVMAGSSAGGHVAASAVLVPGQDDPGDDLSIECRAAALVLYNPVLDTSENGYGYERLKDRWREISPAHYVRPGLPPTIVFHGTADVTVPYSNSADFQVKMIAAGNECKLVTLPEVGHGFTFGLDKWPGNLALRETDRFLAGLGYLEGEPSVGAIERDFGVTR